LGGGWRRLRNEKLHNLYASPKFVRVIKPMTVGWARHVARMGGMRNAYEIVVGKPEGKRSLGRPRSKWEDNVRMDLREIGWEDVD
jgi:hypothetical protein